MSPVLPVSTPSLLMPTVATNGAQLPFVLLPVDGKDPGAAEGKGPIVDPDCTLPADTSTPVPAADLVAALDLAARTAVAPTVTAESAASADGKAEAGVKDRHDTPKDEKEPKADDTTPPVAPPTSQALAHANLNAVLNAAAPIFAQARAALADPEALVEDVRAAKLGVKGSPAATVPVADAPVSKPADPVIMALFNRPKDMARTAERANEAKVEVSVSLLSDTPSKTDGVPSFSLPTTAAHHASVSPLQVSAAVPADAMVNRHLDLARGDAWLDTLAKDIAASAGTGDRLRFALQPEHLGKLDVEVSRHDNGVAVHMTTRSEEARAIIAAAQPRLVDDLRANGTRVVAADVASQMNAQTNGQSGGASRPHMTGFIEAAVDTQVPVVTETKNAPASGRYA